MADPWREKRVIGNAVLYLGDCLEILPVLDGLGDGCQNPDVSVEQGGGADITLKTRIDAVITDPPWKLDVGRLMAGNANALELWRAVCPLLNADRLLIWLPINSDPRDWLNPLESWPYLRQVYIRRAIPGYYGRVLMDGEIIHVLGTWPSYRAGRKVIPGGMSITYVEGDRVEGHPGPRSEIAASWLTHWWTDEGHTVLDPFMGSGTTALAAQQNGCKFIGIEIEPKYYEIACERIENAQRQGKMFEEEPKETMKQAQMSISL